MRSGTRRSPSRAGTGTRTAIWEAARSSRGVRAERSKLARDGRAYALVRYDAALDQPPDVVRGLAAAGLMVLENARLAGELRASRARIANAAHDSRVQI